MNDIAVILPAYNEEEDVEELVDKWQRHRQALKESYNLTLRTILVNDGSSDKTKAIGEKLQKNYDNFILVNHEKNKGLGMAVKSGIEYAVKNFPESKYVCIMDCDNTHDPKYIFSMLEKEKLTKADIVIASRYEKGSSVKGLSLFRKTTCIGAKCVYSTILKVTNVKDYTCGYRLYKRSILEKLIEKFGEKIIEETGFTCMVEVLYKLYICGAVFAEVPFELRYDLKKGASKMNVMKTSFNSIKFLITLKEKLNV